MWKKFCMVICLGVLASVCLFGCGSKQTAKEKVYVPAGEVAQALVSPDEYKGQYLELSGQVFVIHFEGEDPFFQVWVKNPSLEQQSAVVYCAEPISDLRQGDYVTIKAKIAGVFSGVNAFGGAITAPGLVADSVTPTSYMEAVAPALKTIEPQGLSLEQHGCTVSVQKIEFAEKETRIYVKAINNSSNTFDIYSFNTKLIQGDKQFEEQNNWDADYPKIQSELLPGTSTEGIIAFPALDSTQAVRVHLEGRNEDFRLNFEPYSFTIEV